MLRVLFMDIHWIEVFHMNKFILLFPTDFFSLVPFRYCHRTESEHPLYVAQRLQAMKLARKRRTNKAAVDRKIQWSPEAV